jgi:3-methylcrotonyl-CoA carboxylase alpha subunit/geranyl-CoA carboxylase alpha subunit
VLRAACGPHPPLQPRLRRPAFERAPLRFDHAIEAGGEVSPHYDAMLGKLIVHAPTRAEAIDQLIAALAQTELLGLPSNRGLMECLDDARFRRGEALISFLAEHGDALRGKLLKRSAWRMGTARWRRFARKGLVICPAPSPRRCACRTVAT